MSTMGVRSLTRLRRVFEQGFTAAEVAEPLLSVDASIPANELEDLFARTGASVIGLRRDGRLWAVRPPDPGAEPILPGETVVIPDDLPLPQVARLMGEHRFLLVSVFGEAAGVIGPGFLGRTATRMWLFGLVSLIEMGLREAVGRRFGNEEWLELLAPRRVEKARELQSLRRTAGESVALLECVQLSDLATLMVRDPVLRGLTAYESRRQGEQEFRRLEKLRDLLAHSQALGEEYRPMVARLAGSLEQILPFAAGEAPGHSN